MQEQSIMEMVKWITGVWLCYLILAVGLLVYDLAEAPNMKSQINYQVERNGGLTTTAVNNINKYAKENMRGTYVITSDKLGRKVNFGDVVDYRVSAKFKVAFFDIPDVQMDFFGSGVSQVR